MSDKPTICKVCDSPLIMPDGTCAMCGSAVPVAFTGTLPDFGVPDDVGKITGWRAWGVDPNTPDGEPVLLRSVRKHTIWPPRQEVVARCAKRSARGPRSKPGHAVPDENCSCGLYAARTLEHLMSMPYHRYDADRNGLFHVVGQVAMWGGYIEGTQGWRAEKAYPALLFVPYEAWRLAPRLAETYGLTLGPPPDGQVTLKNFLADTLNKEV